MKKVNYKIPVIKILEDGNLSKLFKDITDVLGFNDKNMLRNRPYNGQPHTDIGIRGATEIKNITFRDLRDCFIRAVCLSAKHQNQKLYEEALKGEYAQISGNDLYQYDFSDIDIMTISHNLACEVEKLMGIFPNIENICINYEEDSEDDH